MVSKERSLIFRAIVSTISLLILFFTLLILKYFLMQMGAFISGFEGEITYKKLIFSATNDNWSQSDVLWIFLLPYSGYLLIYNILPTNRKFPVKLSLISQFLHSWGIFLLLLFIFFMPLAEILNKTGIYYPLIWLHTNFNMQLIFGAVLFIFMIYRSVNISQLFSTTLKVNKSGLSDKEILYQLVFIWLIPLTVLIFVVLSYSSFKPEAEILYLIAAMLFLFIINTFIMLRYKVIVS